MKARDRVRALLGDSPVTDDQIEAALSVYGIDPDSKSATWQVQYAAADLLEAEAMTLIRASAVTRVEDISINRGAVAQALLARAERLRDGVDPDQGVFLAAEFHPEGAPWT